jgi:hypothetical protein
MATQTARQRSAAARKAAATRKRNAAGRNGRQLRSSTRATRRADARVRRLDAISRHAERALLIPVGATLAARDAITDAVSTRSRLRRQLSRFERRGATAMRRSRGGVERRARRTRRDAGRGLGQLRSDAERLVDRVQDRLSVPS